jgi:IS4 transposase
MENIKKMLPVGWEEKAWELGAMSRNSGVIREASSLLRLNMLYTTNEGSFQVAATGLEMTEGVKISKTGAHKRIKKSGEWLRWLAQEMCKTDGNLVRKPSFLGERNVKIVDGSDESTKGKEKAVWRLHYVFNLFEFECSSMEVTTNKEGEKLPRHGFCSDDIVIADRIYCTMSGIEHVLSEKADLVLRFKSKAFNLYDENGETLELLPHLRHLKPLESTDVHCYYKLSTGQLRPLRMVAMRKDAKAIEQCKRKIAKKVKRKGEKAVQDDTMELNEYVVLATSLDYTNEQILELYRARWQIEQVFYRLKSLFGYDNVPSKNDDTVKAWFFGKLLLAAICEAFLRRALFPPELESVIVDFVGTQFVDRIIFNS